VVVLGTDGLFDNLSDYEIAHEVTACRGRGDGPAVMAQRLARLAFEASYDKRRITPYAAAATEHFDMAYSGGKPDDITVVCATLE
jgi:protein phosphatase PTC7